MTTTLPVGGVVRKAAHLAHRLVWADLGGVLPDHLHHECRRKLCVNPGHLTATDVAEHALWHAVEKCKTHCVHGHEFTEANTYWRKDRNGRRSRMCLACCNTRTKKRYAAMSPEERSALAARSSERRRQRKREQRGVDN